MILYKVVFKEVFSDQVVSEKRPEESEEKSLCYPREEPSRHREEQGQRPCRGGHSSAGRTHPGRCDCSQGKDERGLQGSRVIRP